MRRWLVAVVVACSVGCASLPIKQQAVVSLQASELALEASHDAERLLCSPTADQAKAITTCDGASAASVGLTTARHQALARAFSVAFDTEIKAATALRLWRAGDPVPSSLAEYQATLRDVLTGIGLTIPRTEKTVKKIQDAVDEAAKVAAALGVR